MKIRTTGYNVVIIFFIATICCLSSIFLLGRTYAEGERRISMDFQNATLKDVLKIFSQQAGLNFVATQNIEGKSITLYLDGVTVEDALTSIMKANNLTYKQAPGSSIFVVKEAEKSDVDMITKIYRLQFVRVTGSSGTSASQTVDIKSIIENILSKPPSGSTHGSVIIDGRTNSIIVTSVPEDFKLIEETIRKLDTPTPQALIEAEIVEIQSSALKNLGLNWGGADGTFVTFSGPIKSTFFPFIREHNPLGRRLITRNPVEDATMGKLSLQDFAVVIKALETEGLAKYLAKPRIMALNNETAEIKITANTTVGEKRSSVTDTGEVIKEAERVETGITLKVTPTINKENYITMTLEPEVSRGVQSPFFTNYVDPAKRSAKTTVMVKDGQTIAIGGLLKSDDTTDGRRVPGASNVPFLGNLFRDNSKKRSDTELIIFITSHVVRDINELTLEPIKIDEAKAEELSKEAIPAAGEEGQLARQREAEIEKTVIKLKKKRELSDQK